MCAIPSGSEANGDEPVERSKEKKKRRRASAWVAMSFIFFLTGRNGLLRRPVGKRDEGERRKRRGGHVYDTARMSQSLSKR